MRSKWERTYINSPRKTTKAFFSKGMWNRKQKCLLSADIFESVCPCIVLLLVRDCNLDGNRLFFSVFHDLSVGKSFVTDFGDFIFFSLNDTLLLGVTHYDINQIYSDIYQNCHIIILTYYCFAHTLIFDFHPISSYTYTLKTWSR